VRAADAALALNGKPFLLPNTIVEVCLVPSEVAPKGIKQVAPTGAIRRRDRREIKKENRENRESRDQNRDHDRDYRDRDNERDNRDRDRERDYRDRRDDDYQRDRYGRRERYDSREQPRQSPSGFAQDIPPQMNAQIPMQQAFPQSLSNPNLSGISPLMANPNLALLLGQYVPDVNNANSLLPLLSAFSQNPQATSAPDPNFLLLAHQLNLQAQNLPNNNYNNDPRGNK